MRVTLVDQARFTLLYERRTVLRHRATKGSIVVQGRFLERVGSREEHRPAVNEPDTVTRRGHGHDCATGSKGSWAQGKAHNLADAIPRIGWPEQRQLHSRPWSNTPHSQGLAEIGDARICTGFPAADVTRQAA